MRRICVHSPGSCGEFIQGFYHGEPCLVSCPVNLYTTVTVSEGPARRMLPSKAARMLDLIFKKYDLPREEKHRIDIAMSSDIPVEKGMASSTADIAGIAAGLNAYYHLGMSLRDLSDLCIAIEPSDNVMYRSLNLFNHIDGDVIEEFDCSVASDILIIDFSGVVNTVDFHGQDENYDEKDRRFFETIVEDFASAVRAGDLKAVGRACTSSARLNQKVIFKPHLETLIALCEKYGGFGVVNGHSGTVVGIMYDRDVFDYKNFMKEFIERVPEGDYDGLFLRRVIAGGISVEEENIRG